ncbi:MAG: hypothetical protein RBR86_06115 [Pseudobdellovibrionaceae bacterium]|nr:hypothetical protein [Pseudobdellovibrionaceae bacterium]
MSHTIRKALLGCLEIPLFMKAGVKRFENTKEAATASFIIPFMFLFPISEISRINPDYTDLSYIYILSMTTLLLVLSMIFYYGACYACMVALERKNHFYQFVSATNWITLTSFVTNMPFFLLVYWGYYEYKEMFNLFIFMMFFAVTYQAFMITHLLRINWMLGTGISIMSLLIDDGLRQAIFPG